MAPLRGMDIIECRTNPVGGAFMRPWLNPGVIECGMNPVGGAFMRPWLNPGVIEFRAGIGQGAINGAPTGSV